ncbi:Fe2+-enterobactin ABC transporter substrate-binding protein [Rhizobiaceae bacterium BDR2-2]|uniref:Fe2+-enterobactin ABC transporter substrate-binding protein n=1 Tax=Ectorhizobium quercum TaxID=2965071 RepID=A0AAE3MZK2_9HYPH|nr:Fe2+-enterobactin ABC transporter substrate-binding protein [Ectorhizobium quercum]MCX8997371.1 Fe2+-enterobactin ABC transporter substrate-binding protein [Ectorhizobium quercum]
MRVAQLRRFGALIIAAMVLAIPAWSGAAAEDGWPRTFVNVDGSTTEIPKKPERILSTSVAITGPLLAIDAPVIASASAGNGTFFAQWAEVATQHGVENVWPAGTVDLEAVYAVRPDLIVVAASGAGSATDQIDAFRQVAPTILVSDGNETWQELATQLGKASGLEEQASAAIADFDAYVADAREKITVPEGTANIISFHGPGRPNQIARAGGAHASLLTALGFTMEDPDPAWHTQANNRGDFVWAPYENLVDLTSQTTFLLQVDDSKAAAFLDDPVLANVPSVRTGQVYGLGVNSFRIDPFSGREIVDGIVAKFGK